MATTLEAVVTIKGCIYGGLGRKVFYFNDLALGLRPSMASMVAGYPYKNPQIWVVRLVEG